MNLKELFSKQIAVYGVGRGNAPALIIGRRTPVGGFLFPKPINYDTHLSKSYFYGCYAYC